MYDPSISLAAAHTSLDNKDANQEDSDSNQASEQGYSLSCPLSRDPNMDSGSVDNTLAETLTRKKHASHDADVQNDRALANSRNTQDAHDKAHVQERTRLPPDAAHWGNHDRDDDSKAKLETEVKHQESGGPTLQRRGGGIGAKMNSFFGLQALTMQISERQLVGRLPGADDAVMLGDEALKDDSYHSTESGESYSERKPRRTAAFHLKDMQTSDKDIRKDAGPAVSSVQDVFKMSSLSSQEPSGEASGEKAGDGEIKHEIESRKASWRIAVGQRATFSRSKASSSNMYQSLRNLRETKQSKQAIAAQLATGDELSRHVDTRIPHSAILGTKKKGEEASHYGRSMRSTHEMAGTETVPDKASMSHSFAPVHDAVKTDLTGVKECVRAPTSECASDLELPSDTQDTSQRDVVDQVSCNMCVCAFLRMCIGMYVCHFKVLLTLTLVRYKSIYAGYLTKRCC
jgi:hypothetical protein